MKRSPYADGGVPTGYAKDPIGTGPWRNAKGGQDRGQEKGCVDQRFPC